MPDPILDVAPAEVNPDYADWKRRVDQCKDRRILWEAQVATCMQFAAGHHKVWWDDKGVMREKYVHDNEVYRTVNYFPAALSTLSARLVANELRWNPTKSQLQDVTDEEVDAADAVLQDVWEGDEFGDHSVKQEMKLVTRHGFLQSGRLVYFRFDDKSKMPVMESYSLWDVYSDSPNKLKDKQWLVIACAKAREWVKNNPDFAADKRDIPSDGKLAESGLQQQVLQRQTGGTPRKADSVLLYYCFFLQRRKKTAEEKRREREEEEMEEADVSGSPEENLDDDITPPAPDTAEDEKVEEPKEEPMEQEKTVIKFQIVGVNGVLQEGELDYPSLSAVFDIYKPVEDGLFYGPPPCNDWIDPSKSIDKTNSNIENYMDTFLHGKWILRSKKIPKPVAGRTGQVIYDESGNSVTQLQLQPLPNTHFQYKADNEKNFEKISGVHDVSQGVGSGQNQAAAAIAQLIAADEQNTSDPVDNYKMFLARCGKKILRIVSDHWDEVRTVYRYDAELHQQVPVKVVGERFHSDVVAEGHTDVVRIRPFRRLDVQLEIGAFWKKSEQRNQVIDLFKSGWDPGANPVKDRIILNSFTIGVGREIVRELKSLQNPYSYIVQGNAMLISNGEKVDINVSDPHEFFWNFYAQKAQEALKAGNQKAATLLNAQAQQHAIMMKNGGGAGNPQAPESPEELMTQLGGETGGLPGQKTIVKA